MTIFKKSEKCMIVMEKFLTNKKPGNVDIVKNLVENGADVNAKNDLGWTPTDILNRFSKWLKLICILNVEIAKKYEW